MGINIVAKIQKMIFNINPTLTIYLRFFRTFQIVRKFITVNIFSNYYWIYSGQTMGIKIVARIQNKMFSGNPTRVKSVNLY